MTLNEVLSKWLGECRHELDRKYPDRYWPGVGKLKCKHCDYEVMVPCATANLTAPNYENDPGAWTPDLFKRIEEAGLWTSFKHELWQIFIAHEWKEYQRKVTTGDTVRSTPAQKAEALSRAIQEVE